jgi:hypothetical protein
MLKLIALRSRAPVRVMHVSIGDVNDQYLELDYCSELIQILQPLTYLQNVI